MHKINILYCITKLELGGAQKQLLEIISRLDRKKFSPFLFTARYGVLVPEAGAISGLTIKLSRFLERPINPFKDLAALIEIYGFIKKHKINIVHTHSSKAGIIGRCAAKLAGTKVIMHTVHGWSFNDYQPAPLRKLYLLLERFTSRFTHQLIVVSNYDRQKGLNYHIGSSSQYALISYGINHTDFHPGIAGIKEELGIKDGDLTVGMVACFKPQKSPQDFIQAAVKVKQVIPGIKFILVGDGILRPDILRLIRKHSLEKDIILTGWRKDIPRVLSSLDVIVLTSLWEGLPIVVLEAMALACPVVATNTGGIQEVIKDGENGFLVPVRDINALSEKIVLLLKDKVLRQAISQNARLTLAGSFNIESPVKDTQNLYNNYLC